MAEPRASAQAVVELFRLLGKDDQKLVLLEVVPPLVRQMDRRELLRFFEQLFAESREAL